MRAGLRFCIAAPAAALMVAGWPALAQETPVPETNTPAEVIGPRELRDFSINGTVTRTVPPAPDRTTPAPAPSRPAPRPATESRAAPQQEAPAPAPRERPAAPAPRDQAVSSEAVTVALPPADSILSAPAPVAGDSAAPQVESDFAAAESASVAAQGISPVPWLIALMLLGAGAGFYFWRQRSAGGYATAGGASEFVAARPLPAPQPAPRAAGPRPVPAAPIPQPKPPTGPGAVVSTRIRPALEIEFAPGRCIVDDDKAVIEFAMAVLNSGSAPARDVQIEARMFNAGPQQDQEIAAFFTNPTVSGQPIEMIGPLKRMAFKTSVLLPRAQVREFEAAGRRLFVPLVGFNAIYRWSNGAGQTSTSYLVGRETQGEKLAPFRLDLGPRVFRGLAARQHQVAVQT